MKTKSLKPYTKSNFITYGILIVAFAVMQTLASAGALSSMLTGLLVPICMYIILAVSLNLTVGILGELSLGHAGFMCVGAYTSSIFSVVMQNAIPESYIRFPIALLIGGLCAAVFGVLIGIPVLRLKGDYLAIVTLAFGEIIQNFAKSIYLGYDENGVHDSLTSATDMGLDQVNGTLLINGPQGIEGTPHDSNFVVGFILVFLTVVICLNFIHSRSGRAVMAIRDNRIAAEATGINITKYKLIAFGISAFLAGIAGVLYSHNLSILAASSKNFGYNMSIMILVFVVLGGMGNIRGSIIAATVLTLLPEVLREVADYRMLIYALALIIMMIFTSNDTLIAYRQRFFAWIKKFFAKGKKEKEAADNVNA